MVGHARRQEEFRKNPEAAKAAMLKAQEDSGKTVKRGSTGSIFSKLGARKDAPDPKVRDTSVLVSKTKSYSAPPRLETTPKSSSPEKSDVARGEDSKNSPRRRT